MVHELAGSYTDTLIGQRWSKYFSLLGVLVLGMFKINSFHAILICKDLKGIDKYTRRYTRKRTGKFSIHSMFICDLQVL